MWERGQRGNNATCLALTLISVTSPTTHKQIKPFEVLPWCWFPGGWVCVYSRTQWAPPTDSPVRLAVSPAPTPPQVFTSRGFEAFFSHSGILGSAVLSCSTVVLPSLSTCECGTAQSVSCCLTALPLHPGYLSSPFLPIWINISSLTPWLFDFHPYSSIFWQFWVFFLFLNWLLSFFWFWGKAKCIYIYIHLSWKPIYIKYIINIWNLFGMLLYNFKHNACLPQKTQGTY